MSIEDAAGTRSDAWWRRALTRRLWTVVWGLLLLTAVSSPAAGPPAAEFPIERIVVEGARPGSSDIIVSESLLNAGEVYTEQELAAAVARVNRLPFVLTAEFALRKGSRRGAYELVVTVREVRRLFFAADTTWTFLGAPLRDNSFLDFNWDLSIDDTVGVRLPTGRYNEVYGALRGFGLAITDGGDDDETDVFLSAELGFTAYNLLGCHATGSLAVAGHWRSQSRVFPLALDPTFAEWELSRAQQASGQLVVPLDAQTSLRASLDLLRSDASGDGEYISIDPILQEDLLLEEKEADDLEYLNLGLSWSFDATDDPLFPHRGRTLSALLEYSQLSTSHQWYWTSQWLTEASTAPEGDLPGLSSHSLQLSLTGSQVFGVSPGSSVALWGKVALARGSGTELLATAPGVELFDSFDLTTWETSIGVVSYLSLRAPRPGGSFTEIWLEGDAEYAYEEGSSQLPFEIGPIKQLKLGLSVAWRTSWGVFRGGVSYLDIEGPQR